MTITDPLPAGADRAHPILIFDSGVGGLSVLAHIRVAMPSAPIIYAADTGGYPYGTKTEAEIAARVPAILGRLTERYRPCAVVIACNTASTIALAHVRAALDLPVVGTVPAIKPAALASRSRVIGVLGTQATVRQTYVDQLIAEHASDCTVIRHGSAELVDIAEAHVRGVPPDPARMRAILRGLYDQPCGDRIDTVALSCTHFPLIADAIATASPPGITLVDSGAGIARRTGVLLSARHWPCAGDRRNDVAVFTGSGDDTGLLAPALAAYDLAHIDHL